jgi:hypothetical protein
MALVTVGRFRDPIQAQLRKALLEGAGIPAFVADEHLISTQWLYSTAVGGARLQVPSEYEEAARELLAEDGTSSLEAVSESDLPLGDGDACPSCGSTNVRPSHTKRSALALSLLVQLPLFLWRRRWVCHQCGNSWRMTRAEAQAVATSTLIAESQVRESPGSYALVALVLGVLAAILIIQYVLRQPTQSW